MSSPLEVSGQAFFVMQSHRRMKTNAEWEALEQKIAGTAHDWQVHSRRCSWQHSDSLVPNSMPIALKRPAPTDAAASPRLHVVNCRVCG